LKNFFRTLLTSNTFMTLYTVGYMNPAMRKLYYTLIVGLPAVMILGALGGLAYYSYSSNPSTEKATGPLGVSLESPAAGLQGTLPPESLLGAQTQRQGMQQQQMQIPQKPTVGPTITSPSPTPTKSPTPSPSPTKSATPSPTASPTQTPKPTSKPSSPSELKIISIGDTKVELSWSAPSSAEPGVTDYIVEYSRHSINSWNEFNDGNSTETKTTVTNLVNNTNYDFRIKAINAAGDGSYSSIVNATPNAPTPSPSPTL
jgi:hypothetical protein